MRFLPGLILPGVLAVLLAGCGVEQDESMKDSVNPDNIKNSENIENSQITWAMPLDYYEGAGLEENILYLNRLLLEDGYPYQLSFLPLGQEEYDDIIGTGRTDGIDILSLGLGKVGEVKGTAQKLLEAGVLYDMAEYLQSPEGSGLYGAFYEKLWESLTIDGKRCVLPNQYGQNGTDYVALRREMFGDIVQWDGTMEELFRMLDQAELPEGMTPILWEMSLPDIALSMGYEYYHGFFVSQQDGTVRFPYQTEALQDVYRLLHERMLAGELQLLPDRAEQRKALIEGQNYAMLAASDWRLMREEISEEYLFLQFPFTFQTRLSGGVGICRESAQIEKALGLLTLLFTQERYANALLWGEPGVAYELEDGFAVYLDTDQHGSAFIGTLMTGLYDLVYPQESDDFPVNRRDTKWGLYGTEAERESCTAGLLPDISAIQEELAALTALSEEYEDIWQEEDMSAALEEVNRRYEELGGEKIAAELERLLSR